MILVMGEREFACNYVQKTGGREQKQEKKEDEQGRGRAKGFGDSGDILMTETTADTVFLSLGHFKTSGYGSILQHTAA